jgi:hypothetical protein
MTKSSVYSHNRCQNCEQLQEHPRGAPSLRIDPDDVTFYRYFRNKAPLDFHQAFTLPPKFNLRNPLT